VPSALQVGPPTKQQTEARNVSPYTPQRTTLTPEEQLATDPRAREIEALPRPGRVQRITSRRRVMSDGSIQLVVSLDMRLIYPDDDDRGVLPLHTRCAANGIVTGVGNNGFRKHWQVFAAPDEPPDWRPKAHIVRFQTLARCSDQVTKTA
jgi:hypothetical protein